MTGRAFSAPGFTDMRRHCGKNECPASLGAQPTSTSQSVQTRNVNSSSLRDIFKVVAKVLEQIMIDLSGAESEENRIVIVTKIVLKLMTQIGYI
jgi:hypothetical protein